MDQNNNANGQKRGALVRVQSAYTSLQPTEKKIARYIIKNRDRFLSLSVNDLARITGTSPASVTRFCKSIGYSGYKEFSRMAAEEFSHANDYPVEAIDSGDDAAAIIHKVCLSNAQSCRETGQILDPELLRETARRIMDAERILLFGDGPIAAAAIDLFHKLLRLGLFCQYIQDRRLQNIQAQTTRPEDLVFGLTFSGASRGTIGALKTARENGSFTVAITNCIGSPVTQVADLCLVAANSSTAMVTGTIASRIAYFCVIDSLYTLLLTHYRDRVDPAVSRTNDAILADW